MQILAAIAESVFWHGTSLAIPAILLYPALRWMSMNTHYSVESLYFGYMFSITAMYLPTLALISFLYRRFILKERPSN